MYIALMVKVDFERQLLPAQLDQKGKIHLERVFGSCALILVVFVKQASNCLTKSHRNVIS